MRTCIVNHSYSFGRFGLIILSPQAIRRACEDDSFAGVEDGRQAAVFSTGRQSAPLEKSHDIQGPAAGSLGMVMGQEIRTGAVAIDVLVFQCANGSERMSPTIQSLCALLMQPGLNKIKHRVFVRGCESH